jgi:hypothetical protein
MHSPAQKPQPGAATHAPHELSAQHSVRESTRAAAGAAAVAEVAVTSSRKWRRTSINFIIFNYFTSIAQFLT